MCGQMRQMEIICDLTYFWFSVKCMPLFLSTMQLWTRFVTALCSISLLKRLTHNCDEYWICIRNKKDNCEIFQRPHHVGAPSCSINMFKSLPVPRILEKHIASSDLFRSVALQPYTGMATFTVDSHCFCPISSWQCPKCSLHQKRVT